eukprot:1880492-Lingulodinium_polyedra.AAC.1
MPRVRFASRRGHEQWIRNHFCVAFSNATQKCVGIHDSPPQCLANRTRHTHHANTKKWCLHGVRNAYDLQATVAVKSGFERISA